MLGTHCLVIWRPSHVLFGFGFPGLSVVPFQSDVICQSQYRGYSTVILEVAAARDLEKMLFMKRTGSNAITMLYAIQRK